MPIYITGPDRELTVYVFRISGTRFLPRQSTLFSRRYRPSCDQAGKLCLQSLITAGTVRSEQEDGMEQIQRPG